MGKVLVHIMVLTPVRSHQPPSIGSRRALDPFRWPLSDFSLLSCSRDTPATNLACRLLRSWQRTPAVLRSPRNARRQKQAGMPKSPARPSQERQGRNQ